MALFMSNGGSSLYSVLSARLVISLFQRNPHEQHFKKYLQVYIYIYIFIFML